MTTEQTIIKMQQQKIKDLTEIAVAMREWIDAVPEDTVLPAMPGVDRDWVDSVIKGD